MTQLKKERRIANLPWEPFEECDQCPISLEVDPSTIRMVNQVVKETSNTRIKRPLYLNTFKLIWRYTYLLCRNFALRGVIRSEFENVENGEKRGIAKELEAIESGINFLRKLSKKLNQGRVKGWCDNGHFVPSKNETYEEKRELIEKALKLYLKAIRKELVDCELLNLQIALEWIKI